MSKNGYNHHVAFRDLFTNVHFHFSILFFCKQQKFPRITCHAEKTPPTPPCPVLAEQQQVVWAFSCSSGDNGVNGSIIAFAEKPFQLVTPLLTSGALLSEPLVSRVVWEMIREVTP